MTTRYRAPRTYARGKKEELAWMAMKARCNNKNAVNYRWYGARGIKVCERWNKSFDDFLDDVGRAPSPKHSLGRIDNNGNYEPGNVRWEESHSQKINRRRSANPFGCKGNTSKRLDLLDTIEWLQDGT